MLNISEIIIENALIDQGFDEELDLDYLNFWDSFD